jgi:hypothetical protein
MTMTDSSELAALLNAMPRALRDALAERDMQAFDLALRQLPPEQAQQLVRAMITAGIIGVRSQEELDDEQRAAYDQDSE